MHQSFEEHLAEPLPLDEDVAPPMERRVGGINAFVGTARELLDATKSGNLKSYDRTFSQGWLCSHAMGGIMAFADVTDAIGIIHSAQGCTVNLFHWTQLLQPTEETGKALKGLHGQPNWYCTNLTEEDVIFGAENKLRETIKLVDQTRHPKAIIISMSCSAGIIGDDVDGIVRSIQSEVNATLVPIHCEPINSCVAQNGNDAMFHAYLKYLIPKPRNKQADMVNVITHGQSGIAPEDRTYVRDLLARAGIRANIIPGFCSVEDIQMASEAAGTVPLCPTAADYIMKGLKQKYGIPYFRGMPFGIAKSEEWLMKCAEFCHKETEMEKVIAEERALVMPKVKALRDL